MALSWLPSASARLTRFVRGELRGLIEQNGLVYAFLPETFPHAVAHQREHVAGLQFALGIIHQQLLVEADGALEHMAHVRAIPHMIGGELFHLAIAQAVDARVADMRQRVMPAAQHQQRQRGGHAGHRMMAARLRDHPAVERRQHLVQRGGNPERFRRRIVIGQHAAHGHLRGFAPAGIAADAIRHREQHALGGELLAGGRGHAEEILVALAQSGFAGLAEGDLE